MGASLNCRDVLSDGCRRRNGFNIERLDRFDCSSGQWQEAIVEDRRFIEQSVIHEWRTLLADEALDERIREDAAIIAASLGGKGEDIKRTLLAMIRDPKGIFWQQFNAATVLITTGDEEGLRFLVSNAERFNREGLWADISLARLGKATLTRLSKDTPYGAYLAPDVVSQRITDKICYIRQNTPDELNPFEDAYALKLVAYLLGDSHNCP